MMLSIEDEYKAADELARRALCEKRPLSWQALPYAERLRQLKLPENDPGFYEWENVEWRAMTRKEQIQVAAQADGKYFYWFGTKDIGQVISKSRDAACCRLHRVTRNGKKIVYKKKLGKGYDEDYDEDYMVGAESYDDYTINCEGLMSLVWCDANVAKQLLAFMDMQPKSDKNGQLLLF